MVRGTTKRHAALLAVTCVLFAGPAAAEVFSDLYLGVAVTQDTEYTVEGEAVPPSVLCLDACGSAYAPVGGIRVGYYMERWNWLGFAGEISAVIHNWGIQSPYEVSSVPISALLMFRVPLLKREGFPNGRVQPYVGVGPSMVISTAERSSGWAFLGSGYEASDTTVAAGFDGRVGLRMMSTDWVSILLEYRFTYSSPSWDVDGDSVKTRFLTNHYILGFGLHY